MEVVLALLSIAGNLLSQVSFFQNFSFYGFCPQLHPCSSNGLCNNLVVPPGFCASSVMSDISYIALFLVVFNVIGFIWFSLVDFIKAKTVHNGKA